MTPERGTVFAGGMNLRWRVVAEVEPPVGLNHGLKSWL
jgi:hypothetical protein